jgi:hypothetical protein
MRFVAIGRDRFYPTVEAAVRACSQADAAEASDEE